MSPVTRHSYAPPSKRGVLDRTPCGVRVRVRSAKAQTSFDASLSFSEGRDNFCVIASEQLSFGDEPVFDVMPVFAAVRLKQVIRAVADSLRGDSVHDIRLDDTLSDAGRWCPLLYHLESSTVTVSAAKPTSGGRTALPAGARESPRR